MLEVLFQYSPITMFTMLEILFSVRFRYHGFIVLLVLFNTQHSAKYCIGAVLCSAVRYTFVIAHTSYIHLFSHSFVSVLIMMSAVSC